MGGLSVGGGGDGWAGLGNPAHFLRPRSTLIGASLTPGLFDIPDLQLIRAMVVVPAGSVAFGASFSRFGRGVYRETEGSLSLATGCSEIAAVGATVRLFHLAIDGYGSASAAALDLGMSVRPSPAFMFSFAIANCAGSSLGACGEELPRSLGAAIELSADESLCMVLEVRKESGFPITVSWGGEFTPVRNVSFRLGCTTEYPGVHAGAGILCDPVRLDYARRWHSSLGATHTLSLLFEDLF